MGIVFFIFNTNRKDNLKIILFTQLTFPGPCSNKIGTLMNLK